MIVLRGLKGLIGRIRDSVLTIGVFDGLHIGHRKIIAKVASRARRLKLKSVVITFDPHPLKITHPSSYIPSLISLDHRARLIGELGIDYLVILNFTRPLSRLTPERFVKDIIAAGLHAKEIYVGGNFYFGMGGRAGVRELKEMAAALGFKVNAVPPIKMLGRAVSSSLVRKAIMAGDLETAAKYLGRPVSVLGTVVSGSKLARALGYPTANINPHHEVIPPSGVYAVFVKYGARRLKGILNIGTRPTFYGPRDREPTIEVHIFDFEKSVYGKDLEIMFVKKIRDELMFKNVRDLVRQIRLDEERAREILDKFRCLC